MAFDLYALGKNLLRLLSIYESPHVLPPLDPYIRKYLKLMACRLLDGTNTDQECALALPRVSFNEIKYETIFEADIDLRTLTGEYPLSGAVPELDSHTARTIQTSSLSPTPFTKRLATIISHPAMHRLARVPQLGFISLVYPTATHSRLEHVLGTLTNVVRYCDALYHDASNPLFRQLMTDEDIKAVLLAGLFHDLRQYPLAHDLQDAAPEMFAHEEIAVGLLEERYEAGDAKGLANNVRDDWGIEPGRVAKIIKADPNDLSLPIKDRLLHTLIDGPIDADKLDYLVRDSTNLNVPFGQAIDFQRLLQCLTIIYKEQERKLYVSLGIHEKGKVPAETVAFARYAMFGSVYWHHTSRAAKAMLHRAVWEGLPERAQRSNYRAYREDLIDFVLHTYKRTGKQGELYGSKVEFSELLNSCHQIVK